MQQKPNSRRLGTLMLTLAFALSLMSAAETRHVISFTPSQSSTVDNISGSDLLSGYVTSGSEFISSITASNVSYNPNDKALSVCGITNLEGHLTISLASSVASHVSRVVVRAQNADDTFFINGRACDATPGGTYVDYEIPVGGSIGELCVSSATYMTHISQITIYTDDTVAASPSLPLLHKPDDNVLNPDAATVNTLMPLHVTSAGATSIEMTVNGSLTAVTPGDRITLYPTEPGEYIFTGVNADGRTQSAYRLKIDDSNVITGARLTHVTSVDGLADGGKYVIIVPSEKAFMAYHMSAQYTSCFHTEPLVVDNVTMYMLVLTLHKEQAGWSWTMDNYLDSTIDPNVSFTSSAIKPGTYGTCNIAFAADGAAYIGVSASGSTSCLCYTKGVLGMTTTYSRYPLPHLYRVDAPATAAMTTPESELMAVDVDGSTYLLHNVSVSHQAVSGDKADSASLYYGGLELARLSGTGGYFSGSANIPGAGNHRLALVEYVAGHPVTIAYSDASPWADIETLAIGEPDSGAKILLHNEFTDCIDVLVPLPCDTELPYTVEASCTSHPDAVVEYDRGGHPYLSIKNYITDAAHATDADYKTIAFTATPVFSVAVPTSMVYAARAAEYSLGNLRGAPATISITPDKNNVSGVSDAIATGTTQAHYYTPDGRPVAGTPTAAGLYIRITGDTAAKVVVR